MAKPEWGIKHECPNCSVRFYDLMKPSPLTCIACGYEFATDVLHRVRKATKVTQATVDDNSDVIDEDLEDETNEALVGGDDLLLDADNDHNDDDVSGDSNDVANIDDDMFPDDDTDSSDEDLPEDLLENDADADHEDEEK